MILHTVRLNEIASDDQTFRISEELDSPNLIASVAAVGQINPLVLLENGSCRLLVVCGFRRLAALKQIGAPEAAARVLPQSASPLEAFRLALFDNLGHRPLHALEQARALRALRSLGVSQGELLEIYLPLLGLQGHPNVLRCYLSLHGLDAPLRRGLLEDRIALSTAQRLAVQPGEVQARFAALLETVRFSSSLQRECLDLLEALSAIREQPLAALLDEPEILRTAAHPGLSPFQRGQQIHRLLYRRRNPTLARAEEDFDARLSRLPLPGAIRISHDPYFETPRLRVEFDASSPQRFRELVARLNAASEAPDLDALFEL
jgi:hypothetical protein